MEGYFLGKSLDIDEWLAGISDVSIFIMGVVSIPSSYGNREFHGGELVLLMKSRSTQEMSAPLLTNARVSMTFIKYEGTIS